MQAAARTVFGDDPELGMDRECIDDHVDVLRIAVSQLRQNLDFVQHSLDALIFFKIMHLEVMWINVNYFQSYNFLPRQVISFKETCQQ